MINYVVVFVSLGGYSNIDAAVSTGSIFGKVVFAFTMDSMYCEFVIMQENIEIPKAEKICSFKFQRSELPAVGLGSEEYPILTISPRCIEEYDTKADVFSFALIVQEMIEGRMPFAEKEDSEASEAYASKERPLFKAPSNCFTLMDLKR
ncbi:Protein kinase-like domain protein [Raphanus sativus]|nr:Protein kinase-like domain protein [Raphanus sativus]